MIGFSGCVGALRENTCFLALYSTIIGLLLLAEMALVILVFASKDWITQEFFTRLDDTVYLMQLFVFACLIIVTLAGSQSTKR